MNIATSIYDANANLIRGAADTDTPAPGALGGFIFNNGAAASTVDLVRNPLRHYYNPDDQGLITGNPNTWTEATSAVKSIYDPCPYGYRVPPISSFSTFPNACDPWTSGDITGGAVLNNAWWAAGGGRDMTASAARCGVYARLWQSALLSNPAYANCIYAWADGAVRYVNQNGNRGGAFATRCIPE